MGEQRSSKSDVACDLACARGLCATPERHGSIADLCDDAERLLDERAPHLDRHLRQVLVRIRRAAARG